MFNTPKEILVYVARHGTTPLNQEGRYRGSTNPDLNGQGWRDAHALSFYLEPTELAAVFYSPNTRTRHTAMLIHKKQAPGTLYQAHTNLRALDTGVLGGQKKTPETEAKVRHHLENPDVPFEGGESLNEFRTRVRPLLVNGVELALKAGSPILIVTHSSVVRQAGELFNDDHAHTFVAPGGVAAIYISAGQLRAEPVFKPSIPRT